MCFLMENTEKKSGGNYVKNYEKNIFDYKYQSFINCY